MTVAARPHNATSGLVCWGTRGSVPTPGSATTQYGGNTPCLEVRASTGRRLVFDAGTGIIPLGRHLVSSSAPPVIDLFLTHFHWDHIQGLPLFAPLLDPRVTIRIHGEAPSSDALEAILAVQMDRPFWPVSFQQLPARVEYAALGSRPWTDGELMVTPFPVRHPDGACGFRIELPDATLVYMPDNEPAGPGYELPRSWDATIAEFVRGADLLIHDAMFTDSEYETRRGWGHGTMAQAIELAHKAEVPRLMLFHHHPERTDEQLRELERALQREQRDSASNLSIFFAVEGLEIGLSRAEVSVKSDPGRLERL